MALLTLPAPGRAAPEWSRGKAARALLAPWHECVSYDEIVGAADHDDVALTVRAVDGTVEVRQTFAGNGRWGILSDARFRLDRGGCGYRGYDLGGLKEYVRMRVYPIEDPAPAAPARPALPPWVTLLRPRIDDPAFAAARLVAACEGPSRPCEYERDTTSPPGERLPPLFPLQPEHPGRPRGSPTAHWTLADLAGAGVPSLAEDEDDEGGGRGPPAAVLIGPVRAPSRLAVLGDLELWELRYRARNGGGLLAIYDKRRDRHRWVFATEGDWPPDPPPGRGPSSASAQGHFKVIAFEPELVLVATRFEEHQNYLFAIDPRAGTARPVVVPWHDVDYRRVPGGVAVTPLDDDGKATGAPTHVALPVP